MALQRIQFSVSGRVQGVNFRYSTAREARKLGVTGFIQNDADESSVSGEAQGNDQAIKDFIKVLKTGPPHAVVEEMKQAEMEVKDSEDTFRALR